MRSLRAEEWLMVGVVGIGAYAAYRLSRASAAVPPAPFTVLPMGPPAPAALQPATVPTPSSTPIAPSPVAAMLQPPPGLMAFSGSSIPLPAAGLGMQGRIETDPPGLLSSASSDADIAQQIGIALGLDNVQVYDTPALAAALGQPWALQMPGAGTRWFWGRVPPAFSGRTVMRPEFLALAWAAAAPPTSPSTGQFSFDPEKTLGNLEARLAQQYAASKANGTQIRAVPPNVGPVTFWPNPLNAQNDGTASSAAINDAVRVTSVNREETGGASESTNTLLGRTKNSTVLPNRVATLIALDVALHRREGDQWVGGVVGYLWNDGTYTNVAGIPSDQVTWAGFSPSQIVKVWKNHQLVAPRVASTPPHTGQSFFHPAADLARLQAQLQQQLHPTATPNSAPDGDANTAFPDPKNTRKWPGIPGLQVQANDAARVAARPLSTERGGRPYPSPLTWTRMPTSDNRALSSPVVAYDFVASRPGPVLGTWTGGVVGVLLQNGSYVRFSNVQSDHVVWVVVNTNDILRSWRNGKMQTAVIQGGVPMQSPGALHATATQR